MRYAVLLVWAILALACTAGGSDDLDSSSAEITGACGSPLGDAVLAAAESGPSTMSGDLASRGNRVVGGPRAGAGEIADAIDDVVAHARNELFAEFFEIEDSWLGRRFAAAVRRLPRSVRVYVLVHPTQMRPLAFGLSRPESPDEAAARVAHLLGDAPNVTVGAWQRRGIFGGDPITGLALGPMHCKMIVADGAYAFVTDTNLQTHADPVASGGEAWYQLGVVVEGEIGARLREEAADTWRGASRSVALPPAPAAARVASCTRMIALGRRSHVGEEASSDRGYAALFRGARRSVRAITPNLNDDGARAALADATEHADVRLVLSKGFNDMTESIIGQGGTNVTNVDKLAKLARNPCNLHIRWYAHDGRTPVAGNVVGTSHAKWASADATTMIIGSQNLDTQSWKSSRELGIAIDDAAATRAFDREFDSVWAASAPAYELSCPTPEP